MQERWESQREHTTTTNTIAQRRCLDPVPATNLLVICPEEWGHWLKRISVSLIFRGSAGTHGPAFSPGPHPLETTLEAPSNWSGFYPFWLVTPPPPPPPNSFPHDKNCSIPLCHVLCCSVAALLLSVLCSYIKDWYKKITCTKKNNYKRKKTN